MVFTGFLRIPDIDGESRRHDHEGEIEISGLNWSFQNPDARSELSGRSSGRSEASALTLTKFVDKSSVYLAAAVMHAKHFDEVVITVRKDSGDTHLDYLQIELQNVVISDLNMSAEGGALITETVSLISENIQIRYTEQADDHSAGSEHEFRFDVIDRA